LADVLLVNAHEAALFLGVSVPGAGAPADEWEAARERFAARGIQQVLVTLGSQGSVVLDSLASPGSRVTSVQPTQVHAVDTTGAGDAFTGAVAVRLAAGDALADAAAFASVAAALATTRKGTQAAYPDTADVERRLRAS
jgi:ribokinase